MPDASTQLRESQIPFALPPLPGSITRNAYIPDGVCAIPPQAIALSFTASAVSGLGVALLGYSFITLPAEGTVVLLNRLPDLAGITLLESLWGVVLLLIALSLLSYRLKRSIQFDPKIEQIVNDREAARLAVPEYRTPWKFPKRSLNA